MIIGLHPTFAVSLSFFAMECLVAADSIGHESGHSRIFADFDDDPDHRLALSSRKVTDWTRFPPRSREVITVSE
jgi:hypothetical protein